MNSFLDELSQSNEGYFFLVQLDKESRLAIADIQNSITKFFKQTDIYVPKEDQLHITVLHVLSPEVNYGGNKANHFMRIRKNAEDAMTNACIDIPSFSIVFDTLEMFPDNGVIIMKGRDNGSMSKLRNTVGRNYTYESGTKKPPEIIHSSILRFRDCRDISGLQNFVNNFAGSFTCSVDKILLVKETLPYTQEYKILRQFKLKNQERIEI